MLIPVAAFERDWLTSIARCVPQAEKFRAEIVASLRVLVLG